MLQELTIDNLAIIKHLTLTFADQMTVLTGKLVPESQLLLMQSGCWPVVVGRRNLFAVEKKN